MAEWLLYYISVDYECETEVAYAIFVASTGTLCDLIPFTTPPVFPLAIACQKKQDCFGHVILINVLWREIYLCLIDNAKILW